MIKIELNDTTLNIPSTWSDIKLADYEQWFDRKPQDYMEYIAFVSDICKVDKQVFLNSPSQLFDMVANTIQFVFDTDVEPSAKVRIRDTDYFVTLSDTLTLAEWVDIESTLESDSPTKISEILAIVCRPVNEKYDEQKVDHRKELFRNLTSDKALPLIAFFLHKKQKSEAILNHYSTVIAQADRFLKDTKTFALSGDGIKRLPIWRRIRYIYLTKSLEKQLSKFSDSCFTR